MGASTVPAPDGTLLAVTDGSLARHRRVLIVRREAAVHWMETGTELSFGEMAKGRRVPISSVEVERALDGGGFLAANLGVSAAVTVHYRGQKFALVAYQGKRDVGDRAHQLVSGYRESGETIEEATLRELGEETLLHDGEAHVPLRINTGEDLFRYDTLSYRFDPMTLQRGQLPPYVLAVDRARRPAFYYHVNSHSAQAVTGFGLLLPDDRPWTLSHCEDGINPATGLLESRTRADGLRLVRLDRHGVVTPDVFTLGRGELNPVGEMVMLSEAFCLAREGVLDFTGVTLAHPAVPESDRAVSGLA